MVVYKLLNDEQEKEEYDKIDYQLIAIHTTLEDYRLAYQINKCLPIVLSKSHSNISISHKNTEIQFVRFVFEDETALVNWNLIKNKNEFSSENLTVNTGLFANSKSQISTKTYFIPEFKKVDFFLKIGINVSPFEFENTLLQLKKIDNISTVYTVDPETIKSKINLIF